MKDDVLIKSNKYGITIYFNSDNSFEELLDDVKNKFQSAAKFFNHAKMAVEYDHLDAAFSLGLLYGMLGEEELAYVYIKAAADLGQQDAIEFLEGY